MRLLESKIFWQNSRDGRSRCAWVSLCWFGPKFECCGTFDIHIQDTLTSHSHQDFARWRVLVIDWEAQASQWTPH